MFYLNKKPPHSKAVIYGYKMFGIEIENIGSCMSVIPCLILEKISFGSAMSLEFHHEQQEWYVPLHRLLGVAITSI